MLLPAYSMAALRSISLHLRLSTQIRNISKCLTVQKMVSSDTLGNTQENLLKPPEYSDDLLARTADKYPHAHGTLNNIMAVVSKELNNPKSLNIAYKAIKKSKHITGWTCACHLNWPSPISFEAVGKTKQEASRIASLKVLQWLTNLGRLKGNQPIMTNEKPSVSDLKKIDIRADLNSEAVKELRNLIDVYEKEMVSLVNEAKEIAAPVSLPLQIGNEFQNRMSETQKARAIASRNKQLKRRTLARLNNADSYHKLPIKQFQEEIVNTIQENRVVVIKGEPGCGKSTQVPQYILDSSALMGRACDTNIIVTQPRRISAISLAERVASERNEQVGDSVGYQVRFKSRLPRPIGGSIRFCSSGILLRILQSNPTLEGVSHVILDEAHERDVNTDMLMLLLKRVLRDNENLKLVIMSATINPELFQKFYSPAAAMNIPGFTHPVQSHYLDDINQVSLKLTRSAEKQKTPRVSHNEVASMIQWIHTNRPEGAILCFLPGWQDIKQVSYNLERCLDRNSTQVLPLHSRLTLEEQTRVFRRLPDGVRKIVLTTNVAETSVTIDDIGYVVDTGCQKEERLSADQGSAVLDDLWVSQANVNQRRGRAGRVRPGECYHLYTREKFESLPLFPTPELHRVPLQKVILDIKTYNENEKSVEFLSEMPEPPSDLAISRAVDDLTRIGALTSNENLTALGRRIARFTTDPRLSKALIHATVFRCLDPMLTIASILSSDVELFAGALEERLEIADIKRKHSPFSDHLAVLSLFNEWKQIADDEESDEMFCIRNMLRGNSLRLINRLRQHSIEQLKESGMLTNSDAIADLPTSPEWMLAVLLSGTQTFLFQRNWDYKNGRMKLNTPSNITESGSRATLMSDCACHKRSWPSPFAVYYNRQESAVRRTNMVRDASCLPPIAIPLFAPAPQTRLNNAANNVFIDDRRRLPFRVIVNSREEAETIRQTQNMLEGLVSYFVAVEGESKPESYGVVSDFRDKAVMAISKLLHGASHQVQPAVK